MRRKLSVFTIAMLTVAVVLGASARADAAFIAYICNDAACTGTGDKAVVDNGVGDTNPLLGEISFSFTTGGLTTAGNTSFSKPLIGDASAPALDIDFNAVGTGNVYFYASDTDFTGSGGTATVTSNGGTINGTSTVVSTLYGGTSNSNLDLSNPIVSFTGQNGSATSTFIATSDPYSLTLGVHLTQKNGRTRVLTTGDTSAVVVPEPASVLMLGLGLLGSAGAIRRRFGIR